MHDATKSCMGKDLFKVQNRSMNFKVTAYDKFIDKVSDSTLQLLFKKLPFLNFGVVSEKHNHKELLKYFSFFYLHIFVRPDFLHILQPKQHIGTNKSEVDTKIQLSSISLRLQKFAKM